MTRMVAVAFSAVVSKGAPSRTAAAKARSCQPNVVSAGPAESGASAEAAAPFGTMDRRPSCARMKFRSQIVPSSPVTYTSARNSPARMNDDSNHPVTPPANPSRAAIARSTASCGAGSGSASAPATDGSPAISRRQSTA